MGFSLYHVAARLPSTMHVKTVMIPLVLCLTICYVQHANAQAQEKRRTGNVCSMDTECPDNAFCKANSYCVCKDGYIYALNEDNEKTCLRVAGYGDQCSQHIQCHSSLGVHAECFLNNCSCKTGTQFVNDRCYKRALISERCISDFNCYMEDVAPEEQAFCVRGYCQCQLHYSPRDDWRCVRDAGLGEPCEDNLQCAGVGMKCLDTCHCREGFVPHNESHACVESVKNLGDSCEFDVQCDNLSGVPGLSVAMCLNYECSCSYNTRVAGNPPRCWVTRRPGQQCHADEECLSEDDEPGFCQHGRCTCARCVPDARDFASDDAACLAPLPVIAAIFSTAAILA